MVSDYKKAKLDSAASFAAGLISSQTRPAIKQKIEATKDACEFLIRNGGIVSIAGVLAWISKNRPSCSMSQQTFYNKSSDGQYSVYRQVLDRYAEIQTPGNGSSAITSFNEEEAEEGGILSNFITNEEVMSIQSHQLRYKVRFLIERAISIQRQNGRLRAVSSFAMIGLDGVVQEQSIGHSLEFTEDEKEAIKDLLDNSDKKSSLVSFDEDGAMVIEIPASPKRSTRTVTGPFLRTALSKIVHKVQPTKIEEL